MSRFITQLMDKLEANKEAIKNTKEPFISDEEILQYGKLLGIEEGLCQAIDCAIQAEKEGLI